MKKLKKIVCTVLALMFVLSLATTALADNEDLTENGKEIAVGVSGTKADPAKNFDDAVYKVSIEWTLVTPVLNGEADSYVWDTTECAWKLATEGDVTGTGSLRITFVNYSNANITAVVDSSNLTDSTLTQNGTAYFTPNGNQFTATIENAAKYTDINASAANTDSSTAQFDGIITVNEGAYAGVFAKTLNSLGVIKISFNAASATT